MARTARRVKREARLRTRSPKAGAPLEPIGTPPRLRRRLKRAHGLRHSATVVQGNPRPREMRGVIKPNIRKR